MDIKSTVVISKSKGHSEILRDIRTSIYEICRNEGKNRSNNHISQMNITLIPEVRDILKLLWKNRSN